MLAELLAGIRVRGLFDDQPCLGALASPEDVRAALLGYHRGVLERCHGVVSRGTIVDLSLRSCQEGRAITA